MGERMTKTNLSRFPLLLSSYDQAGNRLEFIYPMTGGEAITLDYAYDELNRAYAIDRNGLALVDYDYDGYNMVTRRITTEYSYLASNVNQNSADGLIDYIPEYDAHRRMTKVSNVAYSNAASVTRRPLAVYDYAFDKVGNRTANDETVGSGSGSATMGRGVAYNYDGLHRLIPSDYSRPSGVSEVFNYDLLGNRTSVFDTLNAVTYSYANNLANEYNKVTTGPSLPPSDNYFYDVRGNLSRDDGFDSDGDDFFQYGYDAQNRLTQVDYDPGGGGLTCVARYRYDGFGRRIEFINSPPGVGATTLRYYYDGANPVAEYEYDSFGQETLARSYVNGAQYVDERVVMHDHQVPEGQNYQDHYYLLGELYNVAGLADCRGWLEEAYVYDSYGQATIHGWALGDLDQDGETGSSDQTYSSWLASNAPDDPWGDADLDGSNTSADTTAIQGWDGQCVVQLTSSRVDNPYLFTGRTTDTLHATDPLVINDPDFLRLQDNRNRIYGPKHGRWLQRDPLGYVDSANLYEAALSSPGNYVDPMGMRVWVMTQIQAVKVNGQCMLLVTFTGHANGRHLGVEKWLASLFGDSSELTAQLLQLTFPIDRDYDSLQVQIESLRQKLEANLVAQIGEGKIWAKAGAVAAVAYMTAGTGAPVAAGLMEGATPFIATVGTNMIVAGTTALTSSVTADLLNGTPYDQMVINAGDVSAAAAGFAGVTSAASYAIGELGSGPGATPAPKSGVNLPADAEQALGEIEQGAARPNVRSPKPFANDGRGGTPQLPTADAGGNPITYTEHTVNPRPPGGALNGKRIVIGSDGGVWYTDNHFATWTRVK
jgi:RHS repeat-associated protein